MANQKTCDRCRRRTAYALLVVVGTVLLALGMVPSAVAAVAPTHAVVYDPVAVTVFQAGPALNAVRVFRPDSRGGYAQAQTVGVGVEPVALVLDATTGHMLIADRRWNLDDAGRRPNGSWGSLGSTALYFAPVAVGVEPRTGQSIVPNRSALPPATGATSSRSVGSSRFHPRETEARGGLCKV